MDIHDLGKQHGPKVMRIFGYARIFVEEVTALGLTVHRAEPPPRHAHILGWPRDPDPVLEKAKQMLAAKQLAMKATLHLAD